jgi:hypothetical protein
VLIRAIRGLFLISRIAAVIRPRGLYFQEHNSLDQQQRGTVCAADNALKTANP